MLPAMFGMGGTEIVVILIVALLFLGPDKLPEAAKQISKGIRDIKKQSRVLQRTIEDDEHIGGAIRDLKSALRGEDEPIRVTAKTILPSAAATVALPEVTELPSNALPEGAPRVADPDAAPAAGEGVVATGEGAAGGERAAAGELARATGDEAGAAAAEPPRLRMSPTAGEMDDDAPRPTAHDDAELAALVRPAANTVARGVPKTPGLAASPTPADPSEPAEPKHG